MSYKEETRSLYEYYIDHIYDLNDKQLSIIDGMDYVSKNNIRFASYDEFIEYLNTAAKAELYGKIFDFEKSINMISVDITMLSNEDINDIYKLLKGFENIIIKEVERRK